MLYSRDCTESPASIAATRDHVVAHISSCCTIGDDETALEPFIDITIQSMLDDTVRITGYIDRDPIAPYLGNVPEGITPRSLAIAAPTMAQQIQEGLTRYGVPWRILSGAATRGNGQSWGDVNGMIVHHTASPVGQAPSVLWTGRPDLSPPLSNTAGEGDGTICFVAYFPANHAGASGGRSMGPLPVTSTFNKRVWGHEIVYPGVSPMTDAQYRSATILGRVITEVLGTTKESVRAHGETSITGKWDPGYANGKTIDMAKFRNDMMAQEDDDMAQLTPRQAAQLDCLLAQVTGSAEPWAFPGYNENEIPKGPGLTMIDLQRRGLQYDRSSLSILQRLAAKNAIDVNEAAIASAIMAQMTPLIQAAVAAALGDDNQDTADRILDELKNRL